MYTKGNQEERARLFKSDYFCTPKFFARKFCAKKMVQIYKKRVFFCYKLCIFVFKNPNLAHFLKFFARPYSRTDAPFRNSEKSQADRTRKKEAGGRRHEKGARKKRSERRSQDEGTKVKKPGLRIQDKGVKTKGQELGKEEKREMKLSFKM